VIPEARAVYNQLVAEANERYNDVALFFPAERLSLDDAMSEHMEAFDAELLYQLRCQLRWITQDALTKLMRLKEGHDGR
jgi:hypothetical protein